MKQFSIKKLKKEIEDSVDSDIKLNLPLDMPDDLQTFYEELEYPFFHSESKTQIEKLSPLQMKLWNLGVDPIK